MEIAPHTLIVGTAALSPSAPFEAEFAKDRWDARNIPGVRYAPHGENYHINFTGVPEPFRQLVKDYVKFLLASGLAAKTLGESALYLGRFFTFFTQRYPEARGLHDLTVQDIDAFIIALKGTAAIRGWQKVDKQIWYHVHYVEGLLSYLERLQSPVRPREPTTRIIWPHHYPKKDSPRTGGIKYIPQMVLRQLDEHIQHLPPTYIPIVILLRASGWRISDVLYLKLDSCLERDGDKFYLVGDIQKTRVLGHKIPITKEVAAVVLAQVEWVKQHYTAEENPKKWLFPASKKFHQGTSPRYLKGNPLGVSGIRNTLNHRARKYQIRDENGEIFHFRLHAFRHTKAVELINGGMSLVMVQQWMAHASPEMTLIYAKILDETMHAQWEKTVRHGIVQFNDGRPEYVSGKKMLTVINDQQAFEAERVRDYRHNTKLPVGNCVKPPKLICKFTELPCFHCPAYVLTPEDLPALEAYEQQLLERIEIGKRASNTYWIEINQRNLDERVRPAMAMLKQGQTVAKSEKYEREYTPEEWEQRQQEETHE
jgi:integrase